MIKNQTKPPKKAAEKKKLSRLARRTIFESISLVSLLIAILLCWSLYPNGLVFGASICIGCFVVYLFVTSLIENRRTKKRNKARVLATMKLRSKRRSQEVIEAQLKKPEFTDRLENFIGAPIPKTESPVESRASFWQAKDVAPVKTPARPAEFFRMLLQRISKLVSFSK